MTELRYDFEVSPNSTYARAARLIASAMPPGTVVDLGAGVGALGDALALYGFGHVGVDGDPDNVVAMRERGRRAVEVDLTGDDVVDRVLVGLDDAVGADGAPVVGVAMLDVIEHLPDPDRSMATLAALCDRFADRNGGLVPLLVLSVPNVAHYDLAAKLLLGRWDVTEVGLLDGTHITLFTEQRLNDLLAAHGFAELTRSDVVFDVTEQQRPPDLPVFGDTTLAQHLRALRTRADASSQTYQFVRSYRRLQPGGRAAPGPPHADDAPFLTVITRTQGSRSSLVDTLVSLAAQHDRDFEALVMVHHPDPSVADRVRQLTDSFEPEVASRLRVEHVVGGGRSAPLNAALRLARGRYVALLDDDDVVTSDWVAAFRRAAEAAPGRMVRAGTVVQWIEPRAGELVDFEPVSGFEAPYPARFDFVDSVRSNRSPPCCYAVPLAAVRALGIEFDDTLRVCEDWKFELDVARHTGVADDDAVTSVYRRWRTAGGSAAAEDTAVWIADHERVVDDLDRVPTVVPAGTLRRIHELYRRIEQLETELGRRTPTDPPPSFR